jgi:hypothetical protein
VWFLNAIDGRFIGRPGGNSSCSAERGRRNSEICSYFGKLGHTVETCYRKHGFAPGFLVQNAAMWNAEQILVNQACVLSWIKYNCMMQTQIKLYDLEFFKDISSLFF